LRRKFDLSLLPILAAPFILLAPVYLRGQALFWGTPLLQFIPWWDYAWDVLSAGHLPLWNPYVGMGAPLMANYQSALFYPLTWLYFLLGGLGGAEWMAWGQAPSVAVHLAWSGLGMALLARRLGLGGLAQAVAGLSYGLSGYLVSRAGFLSINAAAAWMPWVLLCLTAVIEAEEPGAKRRSFIFLTICLALQLLSGHAQTTWYTWLLAGLWAAFRWAVLWRAGQKRRVWDTAIRSALAVVLALGLAAVQLLPTAEYLAQSQRSTAVDFDYALNYSFWPWHLLTFLAPGLFGSPVTGDYWGFANYWEDAVYIGVLPLLLALGSLMAGLRRRPASQPVAPGLQPGLTWFWWAIFGISLILALGSFTPLYPWLYRHIPTFSLFQAPARWMLWAVFALSVLAAIGAERWRRPEKRALYWTRLGTAGAFSILLGAGLGWLLLGEVSPTFVRATALLGFWCLGAGVLSLLAPPASPAQPVADVPATPSGRPYPLAWWRTAVVLWILLDLLAAGWGLNPGGPLALYGPSQTGESIRALAGGGRLFIPEQQEYWLKYVRFLRFDTFYPGEDWQDLRAVQMPNANMLDSLAGVNNFDPLVPGRFNDWLVMLGQTSPEIYDWFLRLMDVGVIETLQRDQPYGVQFSPLEGGMRVRWVPCQWVVSGEEEARQRMLSGEIDFDVQVVIEAPEDETLRGPSCASPPQTALTASQQPSLAAQYSDPGRLVIDLDAPGAGWLVLSDVWYPGWRAWVDGHPATILRANFLFRAVKVEPGDRQVVFAFQPLSFWLGLGLSLLSGLVLVAFAYRFWRLSLRPSRGS
jgi:hypothetical protein